MFHPNITATMREQVLAARSIIYSKIIIKEELTEEAGTFPHLHDELACIRITGQLTLDDCRRLFPLVRRAKSLDARQIVTEYLVESKPQTQN
jgi:zona occludens toxin (predicted ATPase)